jgi:hypothetical protein
MRSTPAPLLLGFLLAACGDTPAAAPPQTEADACKSGLASFLPCGGDVVGTWTVEHFCGDAPFALPDEACRSAVVDLGGSTVSGTITYAAGGTYDEDLTSKLDGSMTLPDACLAALGSGLPPAQMCAFLNQAPVPDFQIHCTYGTACTCTLSGTTHSTNHGTYEVRDTLLVHTDDPSDEGSPFCVKGDELQLSSTAGKDAPSVLEIFRRK